MSRQLRRSIRKGGKAAILYQLCQIDLFPFQGNKMNLWAGLLSTAFERDDAGCAGFRQIDRSGEIRCRDGKRMPGDYGAIVNHNLYYVNLFLIFKAGEGTTGSKFIDQSLYLCYIRRLSRGDPSMAIWTQYHAREYSILPVHLKNCSSNQRDNRVSQHSCRSFQSSL